MKAKPTKKPPIDWTAHARRAARARWGTPRILRMDDLTPEQVNALIAFADAFRASNAAAKAVAE